MAHRIKNAPTDLAVTGAGGKRLEELLPLSINIITSSLAEIKNYLSELTRLEAQADKMGWWIVAYELSILHAQTFAKTLRVDHG
jgi:hypothetical protein